MFAIVPNGPSKALDLNDHAGCHADFAVGFITPFLLSKRLRVSLQISRWMGFHLWTSPLVCTATRFDAEISIDVNGLLFCFGGTTSDPLLNGLQARCTWGQSSDQQTETWFGHPSQSCKLPNNFLAFLIPLEPFTAMSDLPTSTVSKVDRGVHLQRRV